MATAEEIVNKFPAFAHLVAIPEIKDLLDKATGGGGTEWSQDRFLLELQKTNWFRNTSEAARKNDALHLADPQTWNLQNHELERRIMQIQHEEGINDDPTHVGALAVMFGREGWNDDQIRTWMVTNQSSQEFAGLPGAVDAAAMDVKKMASDYGLPVSDEWARDKARQIRASDPAGRQFTLDGIKASFVNQAKATYAHLAPQLDQGFTIRDIAEPYMQTASQLLELSPTAMNLSDPRWSRALSQQTPDGKTQLMGMGDWQKTLMSDAQYGWDRTNNAKTTAYDMRDKLAQTMGVR